MSAISSTFKGKNQRPALLALGFAISTLIICIAVVAPTLDAPFLMTYAWREAQSAIGAQAIYDNAGWAFYPALCPPWQLAFEFPVYQAMTALFAKVFGCGIVFSGRTISAIMFGVSAAGIGMLVNLFAKNKTAAMLAFGGVIINPYYLSAASVFLIESTALALCVWGLYFSAKKSLTAASILLSVAMAVKATTAFPFLLIAILLIAMDFKRSRSIRTASIAVFASVAIPLAAGVAWTNKADSVKEASGYARVLSNKETAMKEWAYGTWKQKTDPATWKRILLWYFTCNGGWPFAICLIFALGLLPFNPLWREATASLLGWAAPLAVFTNLYYVHAYYAMANNALLLVCMALVLAGAFQAGGRRKSLALITTVLILSFYTSKSFSSHPPSPTYNSMAITRLGEWVKSNTPSDSVIIVSGVEWNPLLSFVAERKTMMVPDWERIRQDEVTAAVSALPKEHVFFLNAAAKGVGSKLVENAISSTGIRASILEYPPQYYGQSLQ